MYINYELSIQISYGRIKVTSLSVIFVSKEKAVDELQKRAAIYRRDYGVPDQPNDIWDIVSGDDSDDAYYVSVGHKGLKNRIFTGSVTERYLLDEDEEIMMLPGTVVKSVESPNIMARVQKVRFVKDRTTELTGFLDMTSRSRAVFPMHSPVAIVTPVEADAYYDLLKEVEDRE